MRDSVAATSPLAFIMAGVLALGSIGVVIMDTQHVEADEVASEADAEVLNQQSSSLLRLLMGSAGHDASGGTWYVPDDDTDNGPPGGTDAPDTLRRLGLLDAEKGYLDIGKFRNLKHAPLASDNSDGYVNYQEARAMLGLEAAGLDFHLRAYPTLKSVEQLLAQGVKDPNMRVAYVGHLISDDGGAAPTITSPTCSISPDDGDNYRFSVTVTNTGDTPAVFQATYAFDFGANLRFDLSNQVPAVPSGASQDIWIDVPRQEGITCDASEITITVSDSTGSLASQAMVFPGPASHPPAGASAFMIELDQMWYGPSEGIQVGYSGAKNNDDLVWFLYDGGSTSGTLLLNGGLTASNGNNNVFDIAGQSPGHYLLKVTNLDAGDSVFQRIIVPSGSDPGEFSVAGSTVARDPAMVEEVQMVDRLIEKFCPSDYNSATESAHPGWEQPDPDAPHLPYDYNQRCGPFKFPGNEPGVTFTPGHYGDVFWDDKHALTDELCKRLQVVEPDGSCKAGNPARLDEINTIIVGSNVDHKSMTSGGFKWPLRDWVLAGGTIIAFGSPDGATQWLQPIFHAGEVTSSGPLSTPDESHPLLKVPDELSYTDYDNRGKAWGYTGDAASKFTDVVKTGTDPITAVSNPGAYGDGTVIITTWLPYDLFGDGPGTSYKEGTKLVNNLVTISYRDLYLDYGPLLPERALRAPAAYTGHVYHDELDSLVEVTLVLYIFEG